MFVQVIRGRATSPEQVHAALDRWSGQLAAGAEGWLGSTAGVTGDGRFVALAFKRQSEPLFYGDLRNAGTEFVSWRAFQSHTSAIFSTDADVGPKWEDPRSPANRIDPKFLNYRYEHHDGETDPLMLEARAASRSAQPLPGKALA